MAIVNDETGLVLYESEQDMVDTLTGIYNFQSALESPLPMYLRELEKLPFTPDQKLQILSWYEGGTWKKFSEVINTEWEVAGAIIWYHPPFISKKEKDQNGNPTLQQGYEKILILTTKKDENERPIVIEASAGSLTMHMVSILRTKGWFLWQKPVKYRFFTGPNGSFRMFNIDSMPVTFNTTIVEG